MQSVASVFAVELRVVNVRDKDAIERGIARIAATPSVLRMTLVLPIASSPTRPARRPPTTTERSVSFHVFSLRKRLTISANSCANSSIAPWIIPAASGSPWLSKLSSCFLVISSLISSPWGSTPVLAIAFLAFLMSSRNAPLDEIADKTFVVPKGEHCSQRHPRRGGVSHHGLQPRAPPFARPFGFNHIVA